MSTHAYRTPTPDPDSNEHTPRPRYFTPRHDDPADDADTTDGYHSGPPSSHSVSETRFPASSQGYSERAPSESATSASLVPPAEDALASAPAPDPVMAHGPGTLFLPPPGEVEDRFDQDSAYDEESLLGDDTMTLASYITNYRYENGRRYHAYRDGAYWGPNDEPASEQMDLAHHMYALTLDQRLHLAPVQNPGRILDVGTGTGIWAIDVADQYPDAYVLGVDLSPIQPEFVPPNCTFEVDDVTLDWVFDEGFDLIHIREMFGSIPNWSSFLQQAYQHTKPGGWVEIVEHSVHPVSDDDTVGPDHFYNLWGRTVIGLGEKFGKPFTIWEEAKGLMEEAGFVDVVEVRYKWPMNGWPADPLQKELGRWNQLRLKIGIEGFMLRLLTTVGGWSIERAQLFLAQMRKEISDYSTHAYLPGTVVYGRKPYS
ncbi:S-adenosyl-L-methionine-dependent methyltransferase [Trichodelitschia bisporula]|uniref:S-adenosyl-L-methionine-dependent methyltransferase n=1 Tax=Trichodelitschia bisporula TaxID=703511 RepID=A0A6G1HX05_9PEZI|nr:S-adenosyl-L-methionine-dependent methyltransferase [Trichodelitschia bisporula]